VPGSIPWSSVVRVTASFVLSPAKVLLGLASLITIVAAAGATETLPTATPTRVMPLGHSMRIMPLGDSITDGYNIPGGYRIDLEDALRASGIRFDFVGSQHSGARSLADQDHEGHIGWRIDEIQSHVGEWLATYKPEVVLLLIGTNDILQHYRIASAPDRLGTLVDLIHILRPTTKIFLSTLPPIANPADNSRVTTYNAVVIDLARIRARAEPIRLVDGGRALTISDLADGVHPNAAGYSKLADAWHTALTSHGATPKRVQHVRP
jgi:lysophospholipase L1-like esterase